MKWFKRILGILLILAASGAMYYWNYLGKQKALEAEARAKAESEAAAAIVPADPNQRVYDLGMSFFPLTKEAIGYKSKLLKQGDFIALYSIKTEERLGKFEVALVESDLVEIICTTEEFLNLNKLGKNDLLLVMEGPDV